MADNCKTGKANVSHSVPCSPVATDVVKSEFLLKTLVPKVTECTWTQGVPISAVQGLMSPNEQVLTLLASFTSGNVTMDGDSVKHLPSSPGKSITQTLNEIWETPKQKRGNNSNTGHTKVAQKEPKKTIAWQLAVKTLVLKFQIWKLGQKILFQAAHFLSLISKKNPREKGSMSEIFK